MKNLSLIALGIAIISGNVPSRQFFLMTLNYLVYIFCTISVYILKFTIALFEARLYEDVMDLFINLPYMITLHFMHYPDAYIFCGIIMILLGTTAKA